ncbi:hypothetical protein Tco_0752256 [Tanacetum coccineum]|uniref:Uncharacterized protein n=1 Tax=Tanacetum coccineum TaxID=301880 RepID=A0ABQ4Z7B3_9ASTR
MGGYKHNQLKVRSYEEIQKLFDKVYKKVSSFIPMDSEVLKSSETGIEGSSKRAGDDLESNKSKKQKIVEHVEAKKDDQKEEEMKRHIEIVKDDEVAIDAIPLATKPPVIVECKIDKDGKMGYFKLIRADRSSKRYSSMIKMLQDIDREDLETLWKLVKAKHENTRPEEDYERVLWGDLKVMFEPDIKSEVWRNLQGYKVTIWKLFDNCGLSKIYSSGINIKPASSLIKRVYMLSLRERMELDLEAKLMGETLVLNRSLDPLYGYYIELNDLNVPLEFRRDQVDDLMLTTEEVVENMDGYRDQDMGDVIFGEPFCKDSCVEARRFDGFITIHNDNDNVTYQMARSHPRFKHLSNAQCNKIKPLLKVSVHDKLNGISHPYQKLKSFYKGVLNLGPKYILDTKME